MFLVSVIGKFSLNHIDIQIKTGDDTWDKGQESGVNNQLDRLHRMLRLAVDTPTLPQGLFLHFSVINKSGTKREFLLKNKKITTDFPRPESNSRI